MAITDVYQLRVIQECLGTSPENVFFFQRLDVLGNAEDLVTSFIAVQLAEYRRIQGAACSTQEIKCINLGDPGDFYDEPLALGGLAGASDMLPPFNAVGFSLRTNTRLVRAGSKRFAGVLEAVVLNGVITEPGYVGAVEDVRLMLDDNVVGTDSDYQPVVVKRIKEAVVGTVPPQFTYRLPTVGDPLVLGLVTQAKTNLKVTSQSSRKD